MALSKLQFRPGINRELTNYANEGGWFDCDKIRFRFGVPETIGGWTKYTTSTFLGTARSSLNWVDLTGTTLTGLGTNLKFYAVSGSTPYDITPIRRTVTLGADPITTGAAGSGIVTISDTSHGAYLNDFVTISGAAAVDGITTGELNKEHEIIEIVNANSYKIDTGGSATSGATAGGGASVQAAYQINTGLNSSIFGTGWGAGAWGIGGFGSASSIAVPGAQLRLWSQDNWGEDLVFNVRDGGIYYWDRSSGTAARAVNITSLSGSNAAPTAAKIIIVSERDRHTIAFGCDPETNSGVQDPLVIRFSSQESLTEWRSRPDTTAGELRLGSGSEIIAAVQTKQEVFILTDTSAHTMQYIGPPFTFGLSEISTNVSAASQNCAVSAGDTVFWMGRGEFYSYNGVVTSLPCTVKEYVFSDINVNQFGKVFAGLNSAFGEVWWFYPSASSEEIDRYVIFNYEQNVWYYGTLVRTCWTDRNVLKYPIAASTDGNLYYQEFGLNDGSANPPVALNAYIESSVIDISEGDQFMFASRIIPDVNFRSSTGSPSVTMTVKARNFPGANFIDSYSNAVTRTATAPVDQYTNQVYIRLRGRSMALRVASDTTNTAWRLGFPRIDIRPDGRR